MDERMSEEPSEEPREMLPREVVRRIRDRATICTHSVYGLAFRDTGFGFRISGSGLRVSAVHGHQVPREKPCRLQGYLAHEEKPLLAPFSRFMYRDLW